MAIPSVGGGYQFNDGNLNEVKMSVAAAPVTATDSPTLTAAQLVNGIILGSPTTGTAYTLPLAADLDTLMTNAKVGTIFDFRVINITGSGTITVTTNTGWTLVGLMTIIAAGAVRAFRARKTGDGTWALYAIS
jgi:hypothetical protein